MPISETQKHTTQSTAHQKVDILHFVLLHWAILKAWNALFAQLPEDTRQTGLLLG